MENGRVFKERTVEKIHIDYFGRKPVFCCRNCDNCCEKNLEDFTDKVYRVAITGIDMDLFMMMKRIKN